MNHLYWRSFLNISDISDSSNISKSFSRLPRNEGGHPVPSGKLSPRGDLLSENGSVWMVQIGWLDAPESKNQQKLINYISIILVSLGRTTVRRHFFRVTQQKDMQTLEGHLLFQAAWALQLLWKQHIATQINSTQVRHCCHHQFATKFGPRTTLPSFWLVLSQTVSSWSKHTCCEILE